ncbi:MAG: hypothetical protein HZB26_17550 [Candidatus Hydrogenedentes bacterium]|nr:hypothetical protein [Candidatus Hydrogenedentota bacterium]
MNKGEWIRRIGIAFWGVWIVLSFVFFEIRFSRIVYDQQKEAIDSVLTRLHLLQSPAAPVLPRGSRER